jgi:hypothetical protein
MSDEHERAERAWTIGSPILMGVATGLIIAALNLSGSLEASLQCASLGALVGLAVGIARRFLRQAD